MTCDTMKLCFFFLVALSQYRHVRGRFWSRPTELYATIGRIAVYNGGPWRTREEPSGKPDVRSGFDGSSGPATLSRP